jgi:hypothetical protein
MSDATIGIIGTLLGTALGFTLSELSSWIRNRRTRENTRRAIASEIKFNLAIVSIIRDTFGATAKPRATKIETIKMLCATMPKWTTAIWQSQLPIASSILTSREMFNISKCYYFLDRVRFQAQNIEKATPNEIPAIIEAMMLCTDVLVENGNPLEPKKGSQQSPQVTASATLQAPSQQPTRPIAAAPDDAPRASRLDREL